MIKNALQKTTFAQYFTSTEHLSFIATSPADLRGRTRVMSAKAGDKALSGEWVVIESYLPPTNRLIKVYLRLDNININIYIEVLLKI